MGYTKFCSLFLAVSLLFAAKGSRADDAKGAEPAGEGASDELDFEFTEEEVEAAALEEDDGDSAGWKLGLAPRVGLDIPTSKLKPFVVAGLELDVFLPVLDNKLVMALDASFTYPRYEGSGNDLQVGGDYEYEIKVLEIKSALDVIYRFLDDTHRFIPFLGAGFAFQYLRTLETSSFEPGENVEHGPSFGFEVLGGLDFRLGPGYLLLDTRFVFTNMDYQLTRDSNAGNVTMGLGYRFIF